MRDMGSVSVPVSARVSVVLFGLLCLVAGFVVVVPGFFVSLGPVISGVSGIADEGELEVLVGVFFVLEATGCVSLAVALSPLCFPYGSTREEAQEEGKRCEGATPYGAI